MRHRAVVLICAALLGWSSPVAAQGGPREGIKVQGHWTVTISNPDGTMAARHEFYNALLDTGRMFLSDLLTRSVRPVLWHIWLTGEPCQGTCVITEQDTGSPDRRPVEVTNAWLDGVYGTRLSGGLRAAATGGITSVLTVVNNGVPNRGPQPFTQHDFATPILVKAGQFIDVTVFVTFSASSPN